MTRFLPVKAAGFAFLAVLMFTIASGAFCQEEGHVTVYVRINSEGTIYVNEDNLNQLLQQARSSLRRMNYRYSKLVNHIGLLEHYYVKLCKLFSENREAISRLYPAVEELFNRTVILRNTLVKMTEVYNGNFQKISALFDEVEENMDALNQTMMMLYNMTVERDEKLEQEILSNREDIGELALRIYMVNGTLVMFMNETGRAISILDARTMANHNDIVSLMEENDALKARIGVLEQRLKNLELATAVSTSSLASLLTAMFVWSRFKLRR